MLIQSLAEKTRLAMITTLATIAGCVIITCFTLWWAMSTVSGGRNQVYVLDGAIPFLAERATLEANFVMEAQAHIQLFHQYFFNIPPDNDYIKWSIGKAMYMADDSALKQKRDLEEKGFFTDVVSTSAVASIMCDSISFDEESHNFTYYGTQLIKRRSRSIRRRLVTAGKVVNVPRSRNNPHGLLVTEWKTIENTDL